MEFGIFSNGERHNAIAADSYDEDLREVQLVDRLGFREAWISEHLRGLGLTRHRCRREFAASLVI